MHWQDSITANYQTVLSILDGSTPTRARLMCTDAGWTYATKLGDVGQTPADDPLPGISKDCPNFYKLEHRDWFDMRISHWSARIQLEPILLCPDSWHRVRQFWAIRLKHLHSLQCKWPATRTPRRYYMVASKSYHDVRECIQRRNSLGSNFRPILACCRNHTWFPTNSRRGFSAWNDALHWSKQWVLAHILS